MKTSFFYFRSARRLKVLLFLQYDNQQNHCLVEQDIQINILKLKIWSDIIILLN